MIYPEFRLEIRIGRSSKILCWNVEHMSASFIERYQVRFFFNSFLLSLLTRGCTDYDIYSVAWALSWTWICPRGRGNRSGSKWRGRVCNYILHEFFADRTYLLGQRGTEHHDLLAVRCASEYFLYVPAHICNSNAAQLIIYKSKWDVKYKINFKESLSWVDGGKCSHHGKLRSFNTSCKDSSWENIVILNY